MLTPQARSFVDKWLVQEPEMEFALLFVPAPARALAACWGALQNELFDAMSQPRDAGVAQVKLAWWGEALARGAGDAAAHPLVRALFGHAAVGRVPADDWRTLVHAALQLGTHDATPVDVPDALRVRTAYAEAIVDLDAQLFAATPSNGAAAAVSVGLLLRQLRAALRGRAARVPVVPLQLLARHGRRAAAFDARPLDAAGASLLADFARALETSLPHGVGGSAMLRCRGRFDGRLLRAIAARPAAESAELSRWNALWTAWRAARGGG